MESRLHPFAKFCQDPKIRFLLINNQTLCTKFPAKIVPCHMSVRLNNVSAVD